ncbi:MAG TPA: hypothetical protein VFR55_12590 [Dehalococcoidia bacterium]|nr:hypothetical protein [Dehalococcoidia bacterium]
MGSFTQPGNIRPNNFGSRRWPKVSGATLTASKVSVILFLFAALVTGGFYGGLRESLINPLVAEAALVSSQPLVSSIKGTGLSVSADDNAASDDDDGGSGAGPDDDEGGSGAGDDQDQAKKDEKQAKDQAKKDEKQAKDQAKKDKKPAKDQGDGASDAGDDQGQGDGASADGDGASDAGDDQGQGDDASNDGDSASDAGDDQGQGDGASADGDDQGDGASADGDDQGDDASADGDEKANILLLARQGGLADDNDDDYFMRNPAGLSRAATLVEALAPLREHLAIVSHFDNTSKIWTFYHPGASDDSTLSDLAGGQIYWFFMTQDRTVVLNNVPRTIYAGWNALVW